MNFLHRAWKYKPALIFYLVPASFAQLGLLYYGNPKALDGTSFAWLGTFLSTHPNIFIVANILILTLLQALSIPKIKKVLSEIIPLNADLLPVFLKFLEKPVEHKLDRFSKEAKIICLQGEEPDEEKKNSNAGKIFLTITQPEKQMKAIVEAISVYYTMVDSVKRIFKVVLFFVEDGTLLDNPVIYYPLDCAPTTEVDLLRDTRSAIMRAIKTRKPVILGDIRKRNKDGVIFVRREDDDREGSLMCHPIIIPQLNEVRMVLSVFTEKPNYFKKKYLVIYNFVLEKFKKRLVIEYCLHILKKKAKEE